MPDVKEMMRAVKNGDAEKVRALLAADPALRDARDMDKSTPLHYAAWRDAQEAARALLEAGADPNAENANDHWGGTPLHAAAHANNRAIAGMLIAAGADVNRRSLNGRTPLEETAIHKATAVAKLLRERGARE